MTITDYTVNATFTTSWPINIPQTIGSNTALAGFTGGTGELTASQKIETWTFASTPPTSQPAAKPLINPGPGKISTSQPISITDSSSGAAIYFTTDGSTPSPGVGTTRQYSASFTLPASAVVKAIATGNGYTTSTMAVASYTVQRVAEPALSPKGGEISTTQTISISDATGGATIYYTTDGTVPSPRMGTTKQYGGPFPLTFSGVVKAIATEAAYEDSGIASANYTLQKVATPAYSPKSGTISTTQPITISDTINGAAIYYTTDGSTPAPGMGTTTKYSAAFTLSDSATVKAIAIANGYLNSAQATASYTCQRATKPTLTPGGGSISPTQTITMNDTTSGAKIYYTTDGSVPSPGMGTTKQYSSSFTLAASATIKAITTAAGYVNSPMASAIYTVK
jgi:hypothetical protein